MEEILLCGSEEESPISMALWSPSAAQNQAPYSS